MVTFDLGRMFRFFRLRKGFLSLVSRSYHSRAITQLVFPPVFGSITVSSLFVAMG